MGLLNHKIKKTAYEGLLWVEKARRVARRNRLYHQFSKIKKRFYDSLWQEAAAQIGARIEDIGYGYFRICRGSQCTFVAGSEVMLDNHLVLKIAGNKPLTHKLLSEQHYPLARFCEYDLSSLDRACEFLQQVQKPCVVKPAESGAAGKGITTSVSSVQQLRRASFWAAAFSKKLLIEEMVEGHSYRLLFLNGEFVDAIRRDSPHVMGDGQRSIKALIEAENRTRLNSPEIVSLHPLTFDPEMATTLAHQHLGMKSIPAAGRKVKIKHVVNQNSRTENESVREGVCPTLVDLGREISALFGLQLAGIDLLTPDISRPLAETGGVINEINSKPALHHHYLIRNAEKRVPVAIEILNLLLKDA